MNDVTKKVLQETWVSGGGPGREWHAEVFLDGGRELGRFENQDGVVEPPDCARAHITACAPEALRLLLEAEWRTWTSDESGKERTECPWCGIEYGDFGTGAEGHRPDCRLLALMVKAGLRSPSPNSVP